MSVPLAGPVKLPTGGSPNQRCCLPVAVPAGRILCFGNDQNQDMQKAVGEILKQALSLPPEPRVALADSLLESLDDEIDEDAEQLWREEVRRRIAELEEGSVRKIPWDEGEGRLKKRIDG